MAVSTNSSKSDHDMEKRSISDSPVALESQAVVHGTRVKKSVRRKVDLAIIPMVTILYLCSFLDRGNIGNARVAGMATDLKLTGMKYQIAAAVFFIPYSFAEVPCNILLKVIRPSIWIPGIMVAWGLVMMCMGFIKNYEGLLAARFFLGLAEAGLGPGVSWYISLWYRKEEQGRPISVYFSAATVAGAFGGFLAFAIQKMDGLGNLAGWAWIFLLEGLATMLIAFISFWWMSDFPETAKFLKVDEKEHLITVLAKDTAGDPSDFKWTYVWETLLEPLSWVQSLIYIGMVMPLYAFSLFLPTIISGLGFSTPGNVQLLTIPPYALGCAFTIGAGILSDRFRLRGPIISTGALIAIVGYAILYATNPKENPGLAYAGAMIAACGVYPTVPIMIAWGANNAGGQLKKGVILALLSGVGNISGICSSFIYRTQDAPTFHIGHGVCLGFASMAFLGTMVALYVHTRANRAKAAQCARDGLTQDQAAEYAHLGTKSPLFRYII